MQLDAGRCAIGNHFRQSVHRDFQTDVIPWGQLWGQLLATEGRYFRHLNGLRDCFESGPGSQISHRNNRLEICHL